MQNIFPATQKRLDEWIAMPEVEGVFLVGSKSHSHADDLSDDDLEVYLTNEAYASLAPAECSELYFEGEGASRTLIYDTQYTSLAALEQKLSSPHDLDHWPYERGRVLFDRDGRLTPLVAALGKMDANFRRKRLLHAMIDTSIAAARAAKTLRRGFEGSGHMLVARGAKALTRILFALEWRWVPLDHWLEQELRTLEDAAQAAPLLVEALRRGTPQPLDESLKRLEHRLNEEGIPMDPQRRREVFFELVHPSGAEERAIHGLY
jgi:Domain of unknown function (DUF4037)